MGLLKFFKDNMAAWEPALKGYATRLFWLLAGIEFAWTAIKLTFKQADLGEILAEIVSQILYIGFFYALLIHSSDWGNAIIESFRTAGYNASTTPIPQPSALLEIALEIASRALTWSFTMNIQAIIISALSALAVVIMCGLMTANMFEALIESYFVISAGVLLMGFGGSKWTSEFAKKIPVYAISVGVKLFVIQLILGLAQTVLVSLSKQYDPSNVEDTLVVVGATIILWIIALNVPNKLQALINGTSFGTGGIIAGAIAGAAQIGAQAALAAASGGASAAKTLQEEISETTPTENPRMIDPYLRANPDAKTNSGLGHRPGNNSYPSQNTSNTISPEKDD